MQRIPVPCKDCPDRHYKCHSECEKYAEYDRINKEIREEKKKRKEQKDFTYSIKYRLRRGREFRERYRRGGRKHLG